MLNIDPNFPKSLLPLAWLDGTWAGYGVDLPDHAALRDLQVVAEDNTLVLTFTSRPSDGWVKPEENAAEGLSHLVAVPDQPQVVERYELKVTGSTPAPQPGNPNALQTTLELVQLENGELTREWVGVALGPRMQWQSLGGTRGEERGLGRVRMFGLVGGELMWSESTFAASDFARATSKGRELSDEQIQTVSTGRVARVDEGAKACEPSDANVEPGEYSAQPGTNAAKAPEADAEKAQ